MKYSLFLVVFSLNWLTAQTTAELPRQKFFTTSVGTTWQTRKDNIFTPLTYSGLGAELHLGSERISDNWYKKFDFWGSLTQIASHAKEGYNATAYGVHCGISQIWAKRVIKTENIIDIA